MKQLKSEEFLIGKTIKRMADFQMYKVFIFKDSTFAVYKIYLDTLEFESQDISYFYPDELYSFRWITKKEYEKIIKRKKEEMKLSRMIQYKILKEEFEGK